VRTLAAATTFSDNSVYVQVGMKVGPRKVARLAERMGIRTPVSHNVAIALGGLHQGVTPLDMAHAYETFAEDGKLTYGTLSPGYGSHGLPVPGPVGIDSITQLKKGKAKPVKVDGRTLENHVRQRRVLTPAIADTVHSILETVVQHGTGTEAQIPGVVIAGKTGTTENEGDAWFVGWTKQYTVAVWVGYPTKFQPMTTEYRGGPVTGGTFPAGIWKTFMESLLKMYPLPKDEGGDGTGTASPTPDTGTTAPPTATVAPTATAPPSTGGTTAPAPTATAVPTAAPTTAPAPTAAPTTAPAPSGGATPPPGTG
jgi:penicillin-binding protein 1A